KGIRRAPIETEGWSCAGQEDAWKAFGGLTMASLPEGVRYFPDHLDRVGQENLVDHIRSAVAEAPLFTPEMPKTGRPLTVRMTNCGALGWVTDRDRGYRYQARHPKTNRPWPAIPPALLELWQSLA